MKTKESFIQWDDIIFENKNKIYGAYELRTQYTKRLTRAFTITIVSSISLFLFIYFSTTKHKTSAIVTSDDSIVFSQISIFKNLLPQEIQRQTQHNTSPVRPDENSFMAVTDSIIPLPVDSSLSFSGDSTESTNETASNADSSEYRPFSGNTINLKDTFSSPSVDKQPEFPGGMGKFYKFLIDRIHYTDEARREGLSKNSYVSFIVNEEGLISDVVVLKLIGFGLDEEVKNVLINSPQWSPGFVRNVKVKTKMILPVSFRLVQ